MNATPQTASNLAAAIRHLELAERVAARRNFDKWSTSKLKAAKFEVRLAHFHNTLGGGFISGGFKGVMEPEFVTAGFAAQDALQG